MTDLQPSSLTKLSEHYHSLLSWSTDKSEGAQVLFTYNGDINQHRIDNLLKLVESAVLDSGAKRKTMKRVCSIMIECLQNASIHGSKDKSGRGQSFAMLLKTGDYFKLVVGNAILKQDAAMLSFRLDTLNKLSAPELRKLYIETLCNQNYSYKGGAGLGLLTVAKKALNPISYGIIELDDRFAFFSLEMRVPSEI